MKCDELDAKQQAVVDFIAKVLRDAWEAVKKVWSMFEQFLKRIYIKLKKVDGRTKHLALYAKKKRIRKKYWKRIVSV